ncbi:hypothetical protein ACEQ8H_006028 [Pleosporales sp. CAS-2024a]
MPPKKDAAASDGTLLAGFDNKETKLLAAAFVSSIGPDKYDYDLMATLTSNTAGSLKKMWPPVKKKTIEAYPSFAAFLGVTGANMTAKSPSAKPAPTPKAAGGRKRKAAPDAEPDADADADANMDDDAEDVKPKAKPAAKAKGGRKPKAATAASSDVEAESAVEAKKKAPARRRPSKKSKKEEIKSEEDSADGGDGMGQYTYKDKVEKWLSGTDQGLETIEEEIDNEST